MNLTPQATQLMQLQTGCAGCKYLAVLDDLWEVDHERHLNPFDEAGQAASGARVLVTTRFAKLFRGYAEVALGLLGEDEAAALILETAELEPTESGTAAAKVVAKLAGYLVSF